MRIKRFNESNVHNVDIISVTAENIKSLKGFYLVVTNGNVVDCIEINGAKVEEHDDLVVQSMREEDGYGNCLLTAEEYSKMKDDFLIGANDIVKLLSEPLKIKTESDKFKI